MAQKTEDEDMKGNLVSYIEKKDARIAQLEKELEEATARRKKADNVYKQLHPDSPKEPEKEEKKEEPTPPAHFVGKWQKYCPTCGDINPEFKDETLCSTPGCGMHLGAIEDLPKLKACPNCGGKEAKKIEAKE